ncbi:MAG: hypothetical protein AUH81_01580 [Candidatus Rokubacteria bacterium 13_1_40CM_4_69_5]|nr:MAG: hypothetical protein AUH81_01580 [Candidatus Rokubacteria bacterium 13_1_40CM_4_69_5]
MTGRARWWSWPGGGHEPRARRTAAQGTGYYPYITDPGEVELWAKTEAKASVTLDVKPGGVYFVKAGLAVGFFVGRPRLQVVPREEGELEIAECCNLVESEASK